MAAGAIVTAEGLWMPGSKLISIPKSNPWNQYPSVIWPGAPQWFKEKYQYNVVTANALLDTLVDAGTIRLLPPSSVTLIPSYRVASFPVITL